MLINNIICDQWTLQTLHCYLAKTNCKICPENEICEKYGSNNVYGIKAVKYAMLLTYAKLNAPKTNDFNKEGN